MTLRRSIVNYLIAHYGIRDTYAEKLLQKYPEEIESAERWASHPYYPADKIAYAEGIKHLDPCIVCIEEEKEHDLEY